MASVKPFLMSLILFLILDFVWLGIVMKPFNMAQLAEIGRFRGENFDLMLFPAFLVYLFMSAFVVFFILPKLGPEASMISTFLTGALAGFLVYGIFDMTNMAIINRYPFAFAVVDMAWGTFLFGAVSVLVKKFA